MFINPWWSCHCSGALKEENDPYSDKYEPPKWPNPMQLALIIAVSVAYSVLYGTAVGFGVNLLFSYIMTFDSWIATGIMFAASMAAFAAITVAYGLLIHETLKRIK